MMNHGIKLRFWATSSLIIASLAVAGCSKENEDKSRFTERNLPDMVKESEGGATKETKNDPKARFARMALDCVNRQYPNKISHVLNNADDVGAPQDLFPAFYGCFDWHSSVHGHWLMTRLWGSNSVPELDDDIEAALSRSFTVENINGERAYFLGEDRASFERPYGMAWFLQLMAEMRNIAEGEGPKAEAAKKYVETLAPLEEVIVDKLKSWLPKLAYPIRLGTHNQSAFAFGLILDWAEQGGDAELGKMVRDKSMLFHKGDKNCPLEYEPSGEDFLSPCLMEADLMRRIMPQAEFVAWLDEFLPQIPKVAPKESDKKWLEVGVVKDASDGKLVHLDGVNLSRAWALDGIASALPDDDPRQTALSAAIAEHSKSGLASVTDEFYSGSHWLASFATYLVSRRGIKAPVIDKVDNSN